MDNNKATKSLTNLIRNEITSLHDKQQHYIHRATSNNTRRAYRAAIKQFELHGGLLPATEQHIEQYLAIQATKLNPRTLSLHLTALSSWHRYQKLTDPTQTPKIRKLLTGIFREHGQPKRKAKALAPEHIIKILAYCQQQENDLKGLRDNALIQVAYFGAFRRSELATITVEQLCFETQGLLITIPRSKTDQLGQGKTKALPYGNDNICPVSAMKKWLETANINDGFVFRGINRWGQLQTKPLHHDSINTIIKSLVKSCGFDFANEISSHSLRRGFATSAALSGAEFADIKRQGGWNNDNSVREYIEEAQLFDQNAAEHLIKFSFN